MRSDHSPTLLLALAGLLLLTSPLSAQQSSGNRFALELRAGVDRHGAGGCLGNGSGISIGAAASIGRRWFAAGSVDLFDVVRLGDGLCDAALDPFWYEGQWVFSSTDSRLDRGAPRLAAMLGRRFSLLGARSDASAGAGIQQTRRLGADVSWRPWLGASLALRSASGLGLQIEYGRHQLKETYFVNPGMTVADVRPWKDMWRLGLVVPLI